MEYIERFYETTLPKINYLDRKASIELESNRVQISSPPKCGKTFELINFAKGFARKEMLFLPLHDLRYEERIDSRILERFVKERNIKALIIDDYDMSFAIPECENIALSTTIPTEIEGFETIFLEPLDFEEYLTFEKRLVNMEHSLNNFLKDGTLPEIPYLHESIKTKRKQEILKIVTEDKTELHILLNLIKNIGNKFTLFQHFNLIKKEIKISKDRYYAFANELALSKIIHFLEKFNQPNAAKKVYAFDFSLKNAISFEKNIIKTFENMLFLELSKNDLEIYYTDFLDFIIPESRLGIISSPFVTSGFIETKIRAILGKAKELGVGKIQFVTLTYTQESFERGGIEIEIVPFVEFALGG